MARKTIKLNADGSLDLTGNKLNFVSDEESILQNIRFLLKIRRGEWFLNTEIGLDHTYIFTKDYDIERAKLAIRDAIMQEENVREITNVDIQVTSERTAVISFTATLINDFIMEGQVTV